MKSITKTENMKLKSFHCPDILWNRLEKIVKERKKKGENCSVAELLRKGAIYIIKKEKNGN